METVRDRLRAALPAALKARDSVAVAALRSALAAIDNAEAVDLATRPGLGSNPGPGSPGTTSSPCPSSAPSQPPESSDPASATSPSDQGDSVEQAEIAGALLGVGAGEAERRSLSEEEMKEIVRREVAERQDAARAYAAAGRDEPAERLHAEAAVLSAHLGDTGSPPG
jgi:uncharacterized protein YqeY